MNKELQIIDERIVFEKNFRIYGDFENPLFLARDVANWIEHNKAAEMIQSVDEEEKLKAIISHSGQEREMWFLTEDGLYEVLMQSRKPIAKQFKKKVKEILKDIRKTGGYVGNEDLFINTYLPFADESTKLLFRTTLHTIKNLNEKIEEQNIKLEEQKPLVEFSEKVLSSKDNILVREFSKIMQDEKIVDFGQNKMFAWLRECGYLNKKNEPYQQYMKYFFVDEKTVDTPFGTKLCTTTLVTPKGQLYLYQKLKEKFA